MYINVFCFARICAQYLRHTKHVLRHHSSFVKTTPQNKLIIKRKDFSDNKTDRPGVHRNQYFQLANACHYSFRNISVTHLESNNQGNKITDKQTVGYFLYLLLSHLTQIL